jgi:hypothetical protein
MKYTLPVHYNKDKDEYFIELGEEVIKQVGWAPGDTLDWKDNKDGSFTLQKKDTEWVLVEAVSTFRQRYMVEVPVGKTEWALDTVSMEEAKEFSQEWLGETIVSHRVISKEDALELYVKDNSYAKEWNEENKIKNGFTSWEEIKTYD